MDLISGDLSLVNIRISVDELMVLFRSLNEVFKEIDLFEFQTRMGVTKEEVFRLIDGIGRIINENRKTQSLNSNYKSEEIQENFQAIEFRLSIDELLTLHQSLNEDCNGFYLANFQERIGVTEEEASELMDQLGQIYHEIEKSIDK